jgi:2-methylcitrate dehydratase PrpD
MLIIWSAASDTIYAQGYKYIVSATETPVSLMPKPEIDHMASLGVKKVAIIYVDEPFPAGLAQHAKRLADKNGIEVTTYEKYSPGTKDFTILLQKVRMSKADAFYASAYMDDQKIMIRQMKEANLMFPYVYMVYSGMPQWADLEDDGLYIFGHTLYHDSLNWSVNAGLSRAEFEKVFDKTFPNSENPPDFQTSLSYGAGVLLEKFIKKAKELILDYVACMVGGVNSTQGEKIIEVFASMKGVPEVQIYGSPEKLPLLNAIYVNSYLATTLDFDDTYDGHPGSTVVPVALGIGELNNIDGKALIESVVAGYEIGIRISNGIKPTPERTKKVRGINTWQIFCATTVAAKLFKLSRDQTAHAHGHAAIHASVPSLRKWGFIDGKIQWLKNNFGWTSYGGVLSALLSREGFIADTTIFDGQDGFWIMASSDQCDFDALREPMDSFYTLKVHTKPYSACRHIHPTLDAVSAIVEESRPAPEHIDEVEVQTFYEVVKDYTFLPSLPFDVVFSAPHLIALALHGIPPGADWFKEEHLRNKEIRKIAQKVNITEWDEASKLYPLVNRELMSKVQIKEKSGIVYNKTVRIPKGDPRNPMSTHRFG